MDRGCFVLLLSWIGLMVLDSAFYRAGFTIPLSLSGSVAGLVGGSRSSPVDAGTGLLLRWDICTLSSAAIHADYKPGYSLRS